MLFNFLFVQKVFFLALKGAQEIQMFVCQSVRLSVIVIMLLSSLKAFLRELAKRAS